MTTTNADGSRRGIGRRTGSTRLLAALLATGGVAAAGDPPTPSLAPARLPPLVQPMMPGTAAAVKPAAFQQPAATQPISAPAANAAPSGGTAPVKPVTPRPNPVVGPDILRNPLLAAVPANVGALPQPNQATQDKANKHVSKLIDPEMVLDIVAGQTRVLVLKTAPYRIQSGDERQLGFTVASPTEIMVQGKEVGTTVLNLWFGDKEDPTKQDVLTYLVRVYPDPQAKARIEAGYKALEDEINRYFKECHISLRLVGDKLVVSGKVRDYMQGGQILRVIRANMEGDASRVPATTVAAAGAEPLSGAPTLDQFFAAGGPNVINLLEVPGEQQVQLKVIVAEVNRAAARSIGLNITYLNDRGIQVFANNTGGVGFGGGLGGLGGGFGGAVVGVGANITARLDNGRVPLALNALRNLEYARSLTDTALVTLNGQTANFQSGGQFPVPVTSGFGGANSFGGVQGVQFVPFGVQLAFTPFITDRDRIRLNLAANISTRDLAIGTQIGGGNVAGLNTRNVNTTVELRQGETLAIAGLIETNLAAQASRVPFFGDLPYLSALTSSQKIQAGEKELVIFVTPELTRPLDPGQMPPLPGSEILDPGDFEFYLLGRLEGHCRDYRSPIRTDWSRIRQFHTIELGNVAGPSGYTPYPIP